MAHNIVHWEPLGTRGGPWGALIAGKHAFNSLDIPMSTFQLSDTKLSHSEIIPW